MSKTGQALRVFLANTIVACAVAGGEDLYWGGGAGDVADNTALPVTTNGLTGLWNATLKNWATTPAPGVYTSYMGKAHVHLGYYTNSGPGVSAVLTLEASPEVTGLSACMNMTTDYNRFFDLTAVSARTLTPVGLPAVLNPVSQDATRGMRLRPNVALAGNAPAEKSGTGVFEVQSDSSAYTGNLRVSMGTLGAEPVTILTATGGVGGTFASWPSDVTVSYPGGTSVAVRKRRTGTVISVL
jgi:autotransporter-associated beta strand protein